VDAAKNADVTSLEFLTERNLEHEHGQSEEEQTEQVGHEEEGAAPLEGEVGESPEVSEANAVAHDGQDERGVGLPPGPACFSIDGIIEKRNKTLYQI
jgi:hypothetical protein